MSVHQMMRLMRKILTVVTKKVLEFDEKEVVTILKLVY